MSLPNKTDRFNVQLTSTKDWRGWNDTPIMKTRNLDLWDQHIKPSGSRRPWLTAPQIPRMSDFERIPHVRTRNPRLNAQNDDEDTPGTLDGNRRRPNANRPAQPQEEGQGEGQDNEDDSDQYYDPEDDILLSNPTETGKADYHAAVSRYRIHKDAYRIQAESVLTLSDWVYDTVAPHLRRTCCRPQKTRRVVRSTETISRIDIGRERRRSPRQLLIPLRASKAGSYPRNKSTNLSNLSPFK